MFHYESPVGLPRVPTAPPPFAFPMLALIAPIGASVVLWAITRSTLVLVFAFLGPVIAVASYLDSRLQARRLVRRERRRFESDTAATVESIERSHERERAQLAAAHPGIHMLIAAIPQSAGGVAGSGVSGSGMSGSGGRGPGMSGSEMSGSGVRELGGSGSGGRGPARSLALGDVVHWQRMPPARDGAARVITFPLRLGVGDVRSRLVITPPTPVDPSDPAVRQTLDRLMEMSFRLRGAPIVADFGSGVASRDPGTAVSPTVGLGICGARAIARASARTVIVQLALRLSPEHWVLRLRCAPEDEPEWRWLQNLPHVLRVELDAPIRRASATSAAPETLEEIEFVPEAAGPRYLLALCATVTGVPRACRLLVLIDEATRARLIDRDDPAHTTLHPPEFAPDFASIEQARRFAVALDGLARTEGVGAGSRALPSAVSIGLLLPDAARLPERGLPAAIWIGRGAGDARAGEIDLVADGPHAVVGGTTGSGKSELLITWVLAVAARHPPTSVNFLLVDFKGGASFAAIASLPHSVGLVSDLDLTVADRALTSLRAEVRFRERMLAARGARSIDDLAVGLADGTDQATSLARLVIVVDEFAALAGDFPELHSLFVDLAARGRSLGIHLILCTQRPADTLRDSILANCSIRLSLRVATRADSSAVIGTPAAAELPRLPVGRALVSVAGETPQLVQIARASSADSEAVGRLWPAAPAPRRPWCEPLPDRIGPDELVFPAAGRLLGLLDLPAEQRQVAASWNPSSDGGLLILGAPRSGRTNTLALLGRQVPGAVWISPHPSVAWEQLCALAGTSMDTTTSAATPGATSSATSAATSSPTVDGVSPTELVLVDDADLLLERFPRDHQAEFAELLTRLAVEGPRAGVWCAMTARSITSALRPAAAALSAQLLLRMPNRQEHVLAGGSGDSWSARLPPGRGAWHGDLLQVALVAERGTVQAAPAPTLGFPEGGVTAIVTDSPASLARALTETSTFRVIALESRANERLDITTAVGHTVIVGTVDAWHARGGLAQLTTGATAVTAGVAATTGKAAAGMAASVTAGVAATTGSAREVRKVFDGCSVSEFRALTRSRAVPPPLVVGTGHPVGGADRDVWLIDGERPVQRARLNLRPSFEGNS